MYSNIYVYKITTYKSNHESMKFILTESGFQIIP